MTLESSSTNALHVCAFAYKFTGKERDAESGLDYFGARYYASSMGRWMSPDWADKPEAVPYSSLDNPQSLNLYGYVLNNPLSKNDPDGHLASPWHFFITLVAGLNTGHGLLGSIKLGWGNTKVDFRKGSQGTDAASTDMHGGMRGTKDDGSMQTPAEARAGASQIITDALKTGDVDTAGHDAIDSATPGHDGQIWDGGGLNMNTLKHELGDFFPSPNTIKNAYQREKAVLQGKNPLAPAPEPAPPPPPPPPPPDPEHKQ